MGGLNHKPISRFRGWWRREWPPRSALSLARCGLFLSLASAVADAFFTDLWIVASDSALLLGATATVYSGRRGRGVQWTPMYVGYWLTSSITIYLTGGLASPIAGLVFAVLFFAGITVQDRFRYSVVFCFSALNLVFWGLAPYFFTLPHLDLAPAYTLIVDLLTFAILGAVVLAYAGAERQMQKEYSREGAANAAKSSFLANVSHELRTPVGAIMGYAELILDQTTTESERYEYAETIRRNGEQLTKLINDLLDLTKIEAGHVEIEKLAFCPVELTNEVLSLLRLSAEAKNLKLSVVVQDGMPDAVMSDPMRFKQILLNVVGNAVKFTDTGRVDLALSYLENAGGTGGGELHVEIRDTGRGLSAEQQSRIFQPYAQADVSTARNFGGTGLGLSLSRKLAQILGGDLRMVKSEIGIGSVFRFSISARPAKLPSARPEARTDTRRPSDIRLAGKRILVVDDSSDNRRLIRKYLEYSSADVHLADSGSAAITRVKEDEFDLVLMDIQMPEMDGLEATEHLRRDRFTRPIVALMAHAMHEDRDRCLKAGCDDYMTKPISRSELIGKLELMLAEA